MKLKYICSTWGLSGTLKENLLQIKNGGFDGVETFAPEEASDRRELKAILADLELDIVVQQGTTGRCVEEHIESFASQFQKALDLNPLLINSHTGKDYYSLQDNLRIIDSACALADAEGLRLVHETHRGRPTFCTTALMDILNQRPRLQLAADFSHWCCVHESFLEDQPEAVERACQNSYHIHARVGHTQSPQINDLRAPEWAGALEAHFAWWDRIVALRCAEGIEELTICPEFGPYPYMTEQPNSREPLADLWELNTHMLQLLKTRYDS